MYKKILVVANLHIEEQPGLKRAIDIARRQPISKITVFLTTYDFSYDMTSILSKDERDAMRAGILSQKRKWIEKICQPYIDEGFAIEIVTKWHNRPYEAILKYAHFHHYDLIIKTTRKHETLDTILYTPTDWHLIRKSDCPLLLVKNAPFPEHSNIVAAIDVSTDNEESIAFNQKILRKAQKIAELLHGRVYLANAYPTTPSAISVELPEFDPIAYQEAIKTHHSNELKALAQKFDIPSERVIVEEGLPSKAIARIAERVDAKLVVMGTQGRTGLAAAFIGNTAEAIIDRLNCNLLALKPDGYISLYEKD